MIPVDLALKVETQLMDPLTSRAKYAARSKLIQALLHEWLSRQHSGLTSCGKERKIEGNNLKTPLDLSETQP